MSYPNEAVNREIFIEVWPVDPVPRWRHFDLRSLLSIRPCEALGVRANINLVILAVNPQAQIGPDKGHPLNIVRSIHLASPGTSPTP